MNGRASAVVDALGIKLIKSRCDKIDLYLQTFRLQIRVLISAKCIKDNIMSRCLSLSLTDLCYKNKESQDIKNQ